MFKSVTWLALGLLAVQLAACPAFAQGVGRQVTQVQSIPGINYSAGTVGILNQGNAGGLGAMMPGRIQNTSNSAAVNLPSGTLAGAGNGVDVSRNINVDTQVNAQTNIEGSKTIDASSNVSVTSNMSVDHSIDGVSYAYGLGGSNVLNVIDSAAADSAQISQGQKAAAQTAVEIAYWLAQYAQ